MKRRLFSGIIAIVLLFAIFGCYASSTPEAGGNANQPTDDQGNLIDEAIRGTFAAQTALAGQVAQTLTAMAPIIPEASLTPTFTLEPTYTFTPEAAELTVSVETNCRSGPGEAYEKLGVVKVGEVAEVVGISAYGDTWIVKLPSNPAVICWVWGQYAAVIGDNQTVPTQMPPPTPTSTEPFLVEFAFAGNCPAAYIIYNFLVTNTSGHNWESQYVEMSTEGSAFPNEWHSNQFYRQPACGDSITDVNENLTPGEKGYVTVGAVYTWASQEVSARIRLCSEDNLTGTCVDKVILVGPTTY